MAALVGAMSEKTVRTEVEELGGASSQSPGGWQGVWIYFKCSVSSFQEGSNSERFVCYEDDVLLLERLSGVEVERPGVTLQR